MKIIAKTGSACLERFLIGKGWSMPACRNADTPACRHGRKTCGFPSMKTKTPASREVGCLERQYRTRLSAALLRLALLGGLTARGPSGGCPLGPALCCLLFLLAGHTCKIGKKIERVGLNGTMNYHEREVVSRSVKKNICCIRKSIF